MVNATPPIVKKPQSQWQQKIQEFKNQIKMPPKGKKSVHKAPPRGTESMQNASSYNIESHQLLYSEEILT